MGIYTELHAGVPEHRKVKRLCRSLEISLVTAMGHLTLLWCRVLQQEPDGNLDQWTGEDMAAAANWDGDAEEFVEAMVGAGLIDRDNNGSMQVHDWTEHCSLHLQTQKRKADRERQMRHRMSQAVTVTERDSGVTVTNVTPEKEKEKEKEKDINTSCTEPPAAPAVSVPKEPKEPSVIELPTNKAGEAYGVTQSAIDEWTSLYPAVDVQQALRSMRAWLLANHDRRKTARGMAKFVNSWLAREQDKPVRLLPTTRVDGVSEGNRMFLEEMNRISTETLRVGGEKTELVFRNGGLLK